DVIYYEYDNLNKLTQKGLSPKGTVPESSVSYSYDISSRLTNVTDTSGAISYVYDALNRVTSVNNSGKAVAYEYDFVGNRTKLTYPDNSYITYEYDQLNRLTSITQDAQPLAQYTYDALSRRTGFNYANNTQTTYQYDNANRLLDLANTINGGVNISTFAYTYDKVGNHLTKDERRGTMDAVTSNYSYDNIYQLTQVTDQQSQVTNYVYDKLGNRTTAEGKAYTSNNLNQYTQVDSTTLNYDPNGNLTGDGTCTYSYDYENRLTSAIKSGTTANYKYDAFGRRVEKNVNGSITKFVYDGDQITAEYDNSGTLQKKYMYGTGIDEVVMMDNVASGKEYFYYTDGLGSITEVIDNTGNLIEKYKYGVYGAVFIYDSNDQPLTQSQIGNSCLFTGKEFDFETGVYNNRARHYNPTLGRFTQPDPIGYYDSINLYLFVQNNPVNYFDPFGEDTYYINNKFNSSTPTDNDVWSHSFVATTDRNPVTGKEEVKKTYSWVNTGGGMWEDPLKQQNKEGAQKAIDTGVGAKKKGDESLDKYVDELFEERKGEKGGFGYLPPNPRGTCKDQANKLINDAIKKRAQDTARRIKK
ncbi:MAG: RHS repeat-associated core domain-containing protein, partial [Planctomycetota bacterium]